MHKINVNESYSAPRNTAISNLAEYANKQRENFSLWSEKLRMDVKMDLQHRQDFSSSDKVY